MEVILKKNLRGHYIFIEVDGKKKKKLDIYTGSFFRTWRKKIVEEKEVGDFSFCGDGKLHIECFEVNYDSEVVEYDMNVTLDKSIKNSKKAMRGLFELTNEFGKIRKEARSDFVTKKAERELQKRSVNLLIDYAKCWTLPTIEDEREFEESVSWLKRYRDFIVYGNVTLANFIEKFTLKFLSGLAVGVYFASYVDWAILFSISGFSISDFKSILFGMAGFCFISFWREVFKNCYNERTYIDFMCDVDVYDERKMREYGMEMEKKHGKSKMFMKEFVDEDRKFLNAFPACNIADVALRLDAIQACKVDNLATRFSRMKELLEVERIVYGNDAKIGMKDCVENAFQSYFFEKRLNFLGVDANTMRTQVVYARLYKVAKSLVAKPFHGVELELIRLVEVAMEFAKMNIKYKDKIELVQAAEYAEILVRSSEVCKRALFKQKAACRHDELVEARRELERTILLGRSITFNGQEKSIRFKPMSNDGEH